MVFAADVVPPSGGETVGSDATVQRRQMDTALLVVVVVNVTVDPSEPVASFQKIARDASEPDTSVTSIKRVQPEIAASPVGDL